MGITTANRLGSVQAKAVTVMCDRSWLQAASMAAQKVLP
jgi:hypothetical protein